MVHVVHERLSTHWTHHRQLLGAESHCEERPESKVSDRARLRSTDRHLVVRPLSGLVLLQLLLPLPQLALRVAGVAAQAVAVEVVVAAGLGKRLALLDKTSNWQCIYLCFYLPLNIKIGHWRNESKL